MISFACVSPQRVVTNTTDDKLHLSEITRSYNRANLAASHFDKNM